MAEFRNIKRNTFPNNPEWALRQVDRAGVKGPQTEKSPKGIRHTTKPVLPTTEVMIRYLVATYVRRNATPSLAKVAE